MYKTVILLKCKCDTNIFYPPPSPHISIHVPTALLHYNVKVLSDDTIFDHDCLRFASVGIGRNLTQSCAIGCNWMKSYLIKWNREQQFLNYEPPKFTEYA